MIKKNFKWFFSHECCYYEKTVDYTFTNGDRLVIIACNKCGKEKDCLIINKGLKEVVISNGVNLKEEFLQLNAT